MFESCSIDAVIEYPYNGSSTGVFDQFIDHFY